MSEAIQNRITHQLRHGDALKLATLGVPVIKIEELPGHTDLTTTKRYMHLAAAGQAVTTEICWFEDFV